jgi:hypothetical protein
MNNKNKKIISLLSFSVVLLLLIPTQIYAVSLTSTQNEPDGTIYKLSVEYKAPYVNGTFFTLTMGVEAVAFGTLEGVIVGFYDIEVDITISGDTYLRSANTTLTDINAVGGTSSTTMMFNLSDITDDQFVLATYFHFYGNNTQGPDPNYGLIWVPGMVKVKEASASIILPILAVLSIAYIVNKKRKK